MMEKESRKNINLFLIIFLVYFIFGIIISYYLNTANYWNVAFDMDCPRVLGDLAIKDYNHYRTTVHPLLIIIFQPLIFLLNFVMSDSIISIIFLQSILATISSFLIYKIVKKISNNSLKSSIITILFALSSGQIMFTAQVETYIYAQFFLLLMWYFFMKKMDKKYELKDYIFVTILGILSLSVTITNFVQFLIGLFFLFTLNKKNNKRILKSILILISVLSLSVLLATIQNIIWPSAPNFFVKGINDFITSSSEENLYISTVITKNNFINIMNNCFSNSLYLTKIFFPEGGYLLFDNTNITNIFSLCATILAIILNINYLIKRKKEIVNDKFYIAVTLSLLFNLCLHLIYGNSISFLYLCHYNFLLLINLVYVSENSFNIKEKYLIFLLVIMLIFMTRDVILMFKILFSKFSVIEYFQKIPCLIIALVLIILLFINSKKKIRNIIISCLIVGLSFLGWYSINNNIFADKKDEMYQYEEKFKKYENQLRNMKNTFLVKNFSVPEEKINIFYFGMVDHEKFVYKNGELIRIKDKKVLLSIDYVEELIIPNEYMVVLKDREGNINLIYENEKGIYYKKNDELTIISEGEKEIKLPKFEGHEYSEVLKVLLQEVLFNIDGDVPKPNIFGYKTAWYRDAMVATMVLEKTNNVSLLNNWVKSINSIYDYSRSKDIEEADNLGELLYIIGATNIDRKDLVKKILNEIEKLKQDDNTIKGMVDGVNQIYYPTVLAIFGAQKNNIKLDLQQPQVDDAYAKLTWYVEPKIASNNNVESKYFPYLNWAFYHYSPYVTNLYILNEIYPLSYEADETNNNIKVESECFISEYYCTQKVYLSHIWHASEMFLFLINY